MYCVYVDKFNDYCRLDKDYWNECFNTVLFYNRFIRSMIYRIFFYLIEEKNWILLLSRMFRHRLHLCRKRLVRWVILSNSACCKQTLCHHRVLMNSLTVTVQKAKMATGLVALLLSRKIDYSYDECVELFDT